MEDEKPRRPRFGTFNYGALDPMQIGELVLFCGGCRLSITEVREWARNRPCVHCEYQGLPDFQIGLRDADGLSEKDIIDQSFSQLAGHCHPCHPGHRPIDTLNRLVKNKVATGAGIYIILLTFAAIVAPLITPYGRDEPNFQSTRETPSAEHWFGSDKLGRDIFTMS